MNTLSLKSFAKVNIGLQILDKNSDGYHNINTVFQEIELHDTINLKKQDSGCHFSTNVEWLKDEKSNLCVMAWEKMSNIFGIGGVSIYLDKKIPAGSGLGGGSSNAATVLKGLRKLYNLNIIDTKLEELSIALGADVPFFIQGGLQLGEGIGERLTKLNGCIKGIYLLVIPNIHIDTGWAYKKYKNFLQTSKEQVNFASFLGRDFVPLELFENDFETIVVPAYPEIGKIKDSFRNQNVRFTSLSGSGSTVYGIFDNDVDVISAESYFSLSYNTFISRPRTDRM